MNPDNNPISFTGHPTLGTAGLIFIDPLASTNYDAAAEELSPAPTPGVREHSRTRRKRPPAGRSRKDALDEVSRSLWALAAARGMQS
jgi:hypothetical protein